MSFPVGFRFYPSDRELVFDYLYRKVIGKPLPCEHVVTECDLYGERDPWQIFGGSSEKVRYFFTKLKKKTNSGSRIDRTVGSGTWKSQEGGNSVLDEQGRCIGRKKMLVYEKKGRAMNHGRWIMHEYGLDGPLLEETQCDDIVLCRIRKKEEKKEQNSGRSREGGIVTGIEKNQTPQPESGSMVIKIDQTVEPKQTPTTELTTFTDLLLMEPICGSNEENGGMAIQIEDNQTFEPERDSRVMKVRDKQTLGPEKDCMVIKTNETRQLENTTFSTFIELPLMEPDDFASFEDMLLDDQQMELLCSGVYDENILMDSSLAPTFDAGDYNLEDEYAWALKSKTEQVISVELDDLLMGENFFRTKEGRDAITPSALTSMPNTVAPKYLSEIGCTGDDELLAVGGNLVEHLDANGGDNSYTDQVKTFSSNLLWNQQEPIQENQFDMLANGYTDRVKTFSSNLLWNQQEPIQGNQFNMLANLNYQENWGFMLKKRRTE